MKVLHIESGLGNQMLDYCDLLAERKANPIGEYYIENIIYSIPGACEKICQWNGYELDRVFGIKEHNIKEKFNEAQWNRIIQSVNDSRFWEDNWRYSDAIVTAFDNEGLHLKNVYSRPHASENKQRSGDFAKTRVGYAIKRYSYKILEKRIVGYRDLFVKDDADSFTGHTLQFCYKNRGIERIDQEIRSSFVFPELIDKYNISMSEKIKNSNSVAVHVRRGDMLSANAHYYKYGYFKRAIKYIKERIDKPVFFFFCDPDSSTWVLDNLEVFGLVKNVDNIEFVSGNDGLDSYRDMQLMSMCKHAVVTNSSFGFWGAYLIQNKNKITCSPDVRLNTTHTF